MLRRYSRCRPVDRMFADNCKVASILLRKIETFGLNLLLRFVAITRPDCVVAIRLDNHITRDSKLAENNIWQEIPSFSLCDYYSDVLGRKGCLTCPVKVAFYDSFIRLGLD